MVLHVDGVDAEAALDHLASFILRPIASAGLEAAPLVALPVATAVLDGPIPGVPASEGVAMGPVFAFFPETLEESPRIVAVADIATEQARPGNAMAVIVADLTARRSGLALGDAAILDALIEVARDEAFCGAIAVVIRTGLDAVIAGMGVTELSMSSALMLRADKCVAEIAAPAGLLASEASGPSETSGPRHGFRPS